MKNSQTPMCSDLRKGQLQITWPEEERSESVSELKKNGVANDNKPCQQMSLITNQTYSMGKIIRAHFDILGHFLAHRQLHSSQHCRWRGRRAVHFNRWKIKPRERCGIAHQNEFGGIPKEYTSVPAFSVKHLGCKARRLWIDVAVLLLAAATPPTAAAAAPPNTHTGGSMEIPLLLWSALACSGSIKSLSKDSKNQDVKWVWLSTTKQSRSPV